MEKEIVVPGFRSTETGGGLAERNATSDGRFRKDENGVEGIFATKDGMAELVVFRDHTLVFIPSAFGIHTYYPVLEVEFDRPARAVLMDLDGTTIQSEEFWASMIEATTARLAGNPHFELEEADLPFVMGHSVSEHLSYCIKKYCPDKRPEDALKLYYQLVEEELREIRAGRRRQDAFRPTDGLKEFLTALKEKKIKIGLVTSGTYEKAFTEIVPAFRQMGLGDPREFYDAIITAGNPFAPGQPGMLSELPIKPHPWLYAEIGLYGLGVDFSQRSRVIAVEDSGAGVCSARLAGYYTVGLAHGNIKTGGCEIFCCTMAERFSDILKIL